MPETPKDATDRIGEAIERELARLVLVDQLPRDVVLAVALSQIVSVIARVHGGADAAEVCRLLAERVETLPGFADSALAATPAAGRA